MKHLSVFCSFLVAAGCASAGFDFSTTKEYTGGNSPTVEKGFFVEFWNTKFDPDIVAADVVYLGKINFNSNGSFGVTEDGAVDISTFITNVTGGSGDTGRWEANGLVYGMVAKGGTIGRGQKASDIFVSENGTTSGNWSVPGGSLSHLTFFTFATIPEPSSLLSSLTALTLVGLLAVRRRR